MLDIICTRKEKTQVILFFEIYKMVLIIFKSENCSYTGDPPEILAWCCVRSCWPIGAPGIPVKWRKAVWSRESSFRGGHPDAGGCRPGQHRRRGVLSFCLCCGARDSSREPAICQRWSWRLSADWEPLLRVGRSWPVLDGPSVNTPHGGSPKLK